MSELNLLVIDTSTSVTVLGLQKGDIVIDRSLHNAKTHSRKILSSISELLVEAELNLGELDGIVFGQGPGSFTGLRIAVGIVQGLAYGANLTVIPVSSMAVLAQAVGLQNGHIFVGLSARLEEIYYGTYELKNGLVFETGLEGVKEVSDLHKLPGNVWCLVTDAVHLLDKISKSVGVDFNEVFTKTVPTVTALLAMGVHKHTQGQFVTALEATPVYLREQVVRK